MGSMKFQVKLVEHKRNPIRWISDIGAVLLFGSVILTAFDKGYHFIWIFILAIALLITGTILARRGDLSYSGILDTDIVVTIDGIRIGEQYYPMDEIQYLDFLVNGHYGMQAGWMSRWTLRRRPINGMENRLHFEADGKKHAYWFFMEDHVSMRELEFLFREFYQERLFFRERNRGGRTFLFRQVVSRQDLERAKREEGYA
jgi:hypothetical protein